MRLSAQEISLMSHAVGLHSNEPFWRNCFSATPNSKNDKLFKNLCRRGWCGLIAKSNNVFDYNSYFVKEKGINFLKEMR